VCFTGIDLGSGHGLAVGDVDVPSDFWSFVGAAKDFVSAKEAGGYNGSF
jgi:hypothetical protein